MLKDIYEAFRLFLTLYADESEKASHKETFSMFVTYFCSTEEKIKVTFLGIVNLKERRQQKSWMLFKSFLQQNL